MRGGRQELVKLDVMAKHDGTCDVVEWPSGPLPPVLITGLAGLAQAAYGPPIPALEFLSDWTQILFGSKERTRLVLHIALATHVIEGVFALIMARRAGYRWKTAIGWWAQTTLVGFPSLRLLLRREASKQIHRKPH